MAACEEMVPVDCIMDDAYGLTSTSKKLAMTTGRLDESLSHSGLMRFSLARPTDHRCGIPFI